MTTRRDILLWLPLALLATVLVLLFLPLLRGETLFWGLPALQFYPWREFAFEQLGKGHLPAWNPYLGAGAPLLANYQTAIFYPPNWLWLLLPGSAAMTAIALLHVLWSGLGMWQFTGALEFTPFGRGVSMLAYALSGYLIARLMSFPTANAGAWLPWLFWLVHRALTRCRLADTGWLGLGFGLLLLAGHAQTTWYTAVGVGMYALWLTGWQRRRDPLRTRGIALLLMVAGMLLGVLVAVIQLIPTAEYLAESQRSTGLDFDTTANLSYHPIQLLTLLSPHFLGTPADGSFLTRGIFFEDAAYIGFIPLVAALAAIWGWIRQRRDPDVPSTLQTVPFWALLTITTLLIAMGKYGPVFHILYDYVPTFDAFREPVRWMILPVFSLSMLAGIGVEQWGRGKWIVFWSRLAAAGGGAMALMAVAGLTWGNFDAENLEVLSWGMVALGASMVTAALLTLTQPQPPLVGSHVLWRSVVLIVIACDMVWMAGGLNPTIDANFWDRREVDIPGRVYWFDDYQHDVIFGADEDPDAGIPAIEGCFDVGDYRIAVRRHEELRTSQLPNITMLDRVLSLKNNDPLLSGYHSAYLDLIEALGPDSGNLLRAAGVGQVYGVIPSGWQVDDHYSAVAPFDPITAWLVTGAIWQADDAEVESVLRDPDWDPTMQVILAGAPPVEGADEIVSPGATTGEIALLTFDPPERRYHVTVDTPAYLVIAETWYPGWSVSVNGEEASLHRANLAFMAVRVPAGESEVVLRYTLNHWPLNAVLTFTGLVLAMALIGSRWILARTHRTGKSDA